MYKTFSKSHQSLCDVIELQASEILEDLQDEGWLW